MNIYQSSTYTKNLNWLHFDDEPRVQERQQVKDQQSCVSVFVAYPTSPSSGYEHQPGHDNSILCSSECITDIRFCTWKTNIRYQKHLLIFVLSMIHLQPDLICLKQFRYCPRALRFPSKFLTLSVTPVFDKFLSSTIKLVVTTIQSSFLLITW